MSDSRKFLKLIQEDAFARLSVAADFTTVGLILARKAVTEQEVQQKRGVQSGRGGKVGTCVVVEMPVVRVDSPNAPGPSTIVEQSFLVLEHPEMNAGTTGSGLSAEQLAVDCLQLFHHFMPFGTSQVMTAADDAIVPDFTFKNLVGYRVTVSTLIALRRRAKVQLPTISPVTGAAPLQITLACPTSGAAIWYTVDNTYPSSANVPASTLYTVPFTLATAATLRVGAEKSGLQPSDIAQLDSS